MKNLIQTSASSKEFQNRQLLTAIKEMIKTPLLRQEGFKQLLKIDADSLFTGNQIYYYYIKGKYYVLTFKDALDKDTELLAYANDCYTDMVTIAYENGYPIKNGKYHFSRAYCKYLIAINHSSEEVKSKLFQKVAQITTRVLCYHPDNTSCKWLQSQLDLE